MLRITDADDLTQSWTVSEAEFAADNADDDDVNIRLMLAEIEAAGLAILGGGAAPLWIVEREG